MGSESCAFIVSSLQRKRVGAQGLHLNVLLRFEVALFEYLASSCAEGIVHVHVHNSSQPFFGHNSASLTRSRLGLLVESFGRLVAPGLTLLRDLADQAVQAGRPGLSRAALVSGALRELGVALCWGNASLCCSVAYVATRAAGRTPMRGLARPSAEVVKACLVPRVWVWGV
jgi:hypothetical protein